jgi:phospholipase C
VWDAGAHDLWVLGPGGFHRHFIGDAGRPQPVVTVAFDAGRRLVLTLANPGRIERRISVAPGAYLGVLKPWQADLRPGATAVHRWPLAASRGWYDLSIRTGEPGGYLRRLAGRLETGADSITDPAMAGPAVMDQALG